MQKIFYLFLLLPLFSLAQPQTYPSSFHVAKEGPADFHTVQEAINAVRDLSQQTVVIYIAAGIYQEKLVIPSWKTNIVLKGAGADQTIITWSDYSGKPVPGGKDAFGKDKMSTYTSYTLLIAGNDNTLEDLTIANEAGRVGQAVALHVEGDRCTVRNCKLLGNQDTVYLAGDGNRIYMANSYIEGTTDFIFGEATAVFDSCTIKSLINSYITAASTRPFSEYGFVFRDCKLIHDTAAKKVFLGRPWRPYAKTVWIRTYMEDHILPVGWDNWRNPENEKTVTYQEYASSGAGANAAKRANWSRQLSRKEAASYSTKKILRNWQPPAYL